MDGGWSDGGHGGDHGYSDSGLPDYQTNLILFPDDEMKKRDWIVFFIGFALAAATIFYLVYYR